MKLIVAGNEKEYADGLTVARLIELEQVETPEYVTVSVNDEFVAGGALAETALHDGDSVEFLYFMGGGR
jgi:sulfur carrier protein